MAKFYCNGLTVTIKRLSKICMTCQKRSAKPGNQVMGQIPDRKLGSLKQFSLVSMDACGHFKVKILNSSMKVWVLVIACLQTKAVHLEVLEGLKTEEVINALERVVARRGKIEEIHADNFASFVATKTLVTQEQKRLPEDKDWPEDKERKTRPGEQELDMNEVQNKLSKNVWKWSFSKPYSSEGNGVAEAMVKLTKEAMHTTFRHADIRINEFRTVVAKAEARVNSRPVATFKPNDCWENIVVLTPQHFAIGRLGGEVAPEADIKDLYNLPTRWTIMQRHFTRYNKEWNKGFHAQVLGSHKWAKMVEEIRTGTLVLVMSDNEKRYNWPLGLVTQVHRSKDGIVRAVSVRTQCMEGQRPTTVSRNVRQLIPLTMFENADECPAPNREAEAAKVKVELITEPVSEGTAKQPSTTTAEAVEARRRGRHHQGRPQPWLEAEAKSQGEKSPTLDEGRSAPLGPSEKAAATSEVNQRQLSDTLFPSERASKVEDAEDDNAAHGQHNTEIKTRLPLQHGEKEPENAKKKPHQEAAAVEKAGNDYSDGRKNGDNSGEIPDAEAQNTTRNSQETPQCREKKPEEEGSDIEAKHNNGELPEEPCKKGAESSEETPKNANARSNESNDHQQQQERLQEDAITESTKSVQKKPKAKYKTEVEKLLEMQSGLEVVTSRRSDMVAIIEQENTNQCESNETRIKGDGPKTGAEE
jgi:hypothetical protein